jgi:hypothetical protein
MSGGLTKSIKKVGGGGSIHAQSAKLCASTVNWQ